MSDQEQKPDQNSEQKPEETQENESSELTSETPEPSAPVKSSEQPEVESAPADSEPAPAENAAETAESGAPAAEGAEAAEAASAEAPAAEAEAAEKPAVSPEAAETAESGAPAAEGAEADEAASAEAPAAEAEVAEKPTASPEAPEAAETPEPEAKKISFEPQGEGPFYGTGRRKTSVARVYVKTGSGEVRINGRPADEFFTSQLWRNQALEPMTKFGLGAQLDVRVSVEGGGSSGQAGAIRMGLARALAVASPNFRQEMRNAGFLTRDARRRERKKYGQKGARRRFQWTKR